MPSTTHPRSSTAPNRIRLGPESPETPRFALRRTEPTAHRRARCRPSPVTCSPGSNYWFRRTRRACRRVPVCFLGESRSRWNLSMRLRRVGNATPYSVLVFIQTPHLGRLRCKFPHHENTNTQNQPPGRRPTGEAQRSGLGFLATWQFFGIVKTNTASGICAPSQGSSP